MFESVVFGGAVFESAAVGVPDDTRDEATMTFVVLRTGAVADLAIHAVGRA